MSGPAYQMLENRFRRLAALRDAEAVLQWDQAAMMPPGGAAGRAEQLAELRAVRHGLLTAAETGDLIADADADPALSPGQRANLAEMERLWRRATALTEQQVVALSRAVSGCETAWRAARPAADFSAVLAPLEEVVARVRETAEALAGQLGVPPYDALLDAHEPGGTVVEIDAVFTDLEAFLPDFLGEVLDRQRRAPPPLRPQGPFPVEAQRALGRRFMEILGFDFDHGRLDVSLHPFCGGCPDDVRITTRYDEADFASALMAVIHESGHALYERGLPSEWRGQPAGDARGMSLHESQSLLVEMQVCRSPAFLAFAGPLLAETFGGDGAAWSPDNLARLYTRVEPGFIRVDADEVTYPLHVILRYRLERAMIEGSLAPRDLPTAWNEGMRRFLDLEPPSDREGCLQDIHWYDGAWGYFPTYTLGALTAAQLSAAARRADGAIEVGIARGDFAPLLNWLRANVHAKGSLLSTREILEQSTGGPLDAAHFKEHLRRRYLD
jgi:carboxypeptidase Taq